MSNPSTSGGAWKRILTDCFQGEQLRLWREAKERLGPGFDHDGYAARWVDYNARVQAALPLTPDAPATQAIVQEWDDLCGIYLTKISADEQRAAAPLWQFPMLLDDPEMFRRR